ncbi:MAG: hypothetical protein NTV69_16325, partial [Caldilinea sp.]|nr:hypothetical protein [Caldilinea sp.]
RPTRRAPPSSPANAPRPTEPSGQRAAPHRACRPTRRAPPILPANAPRPTEPAGQRAAQKQGTTLLSPLPGAFVQVQRHVSDEVTRPHPTYSYNCFYN